MTYWRNTTTKTEWRKWCLPFKTAEAKFCCCNEAKPGLIVPFDVVVVVVDVDADADAVEKPDLVPATTAAAADVKVGMED